MKPIPLLSSFALFFSSIAFAELRTPSIIGENMVLQRNHLNPIWGWAEADETITVSIAGQSHKTKADEKGHWEVTLDPMVASAKPKTLSVKGKSSSLSYANVLVGEVWLCSGQSNMGWAVNSSDESDLEIMTANYSELRLISIPQVGTQEPQGDFNGQWEATTPEVAKNFSAVGYFSEEDFTRHSRFPSV